MALMVFLATGFAANFLAATFSIFQKQNQSEKVWLTV
jgi:hypothetical protein